MRNTMRSFRGRVVPCCATIGKFSVKRETYSNLRSNPVPTLLLTNVRHERTGVYIANHVWINPANMMFHDSFPDQAVYTPGTTVTFSAVIVEYQKGLLRRKTDFEFVNIHDFSRSGADAL